jgi:hypothetical protein
MTTLMVGEWGSGGASLQLDIHWLECVYFYLLLVQMRRVTSMIL